MRQISNSDYRRSKCCQVALTVGAQLEMTLDQRLMQTLNALPAARRQEVLDFAEFLRSQVEQSPAGTRSELTPLPVLPGRMTPGWKDAIYGER